MQNQRDKSLVAMNLRLTLSRKTVNIEKSLLPSQRKNTRCKKHD